MNILLINSPVVWVGVKRPIFPLGLAYIGTFLENHGCKVRLIDLNIYANHLQELQNLLQKNRFDFVGVSMRSILCYNTPQIYQWNNIIKTVKSLSPHSKIVCGGAAFSLLPREIMNSIEEIDMGVIGRGEAAFLELIEKPPYQVKGIVFRENKDIHFTPRREEIDLEDLPIPKRDWFNLDLSKYDMLNLLTRVGCPFKCRYCQHKYLEGVKMRCRNLSSVHKEIEHLHSLGIRKFFFVDSVFNYPVEYSLNIIDILKQYDLEWTAYFRPDLLDKDYIEKIVESKCKTVIVSAESGSQNMHNYLNTGISVNAILNVLRFSSALAKDKTTVHFSFMIGMPKEKIIDIFKTFILMVKILFNGCSIGLRPFICSCQSEIGREELSKRCKKNVFVRKHALYRKILYPIYWFLILYDFIVERKLKAR